MLQACEKLLANLLVASRWLMAPLYVGLLAVLVVVVVAFFHDLVETIRGLADLHRDGVILATLHLIDLVLVGNLVLIVIGAGIDTVVSRRVADGLRSRPSWMAKEDFAGLKLKIVASIIAIAAVDLLETFYRDRYGGPGSDGLAARAVSGLRRRRGPARVDGPADGGQPLGRAR